ncbi:YkgJ family cysteine cluster protein [bacterium]|nr:YkgJ family cysteine cluster protein [bacterium]
MSDLEVHFENLKLNYREIFLKSALNIQSEVEVLKPKDFDGEIFSKYKQNSVGYVWQKDVFEFLKLRFIKLRKKSLEIYNLSREECSCSGCGVCCKFAVSEFSPSELEQKAKIGDNIAKQFIQTFIPYESLDEAEKIYPQYVKMLKNQTENGYYIYYCPKVTQDNKCPDYENRPQICRDFPDNPIAFLAPNCGYKSWKLKSEPVWLKLSAESEIINFYLDKLKDLLKL